MRRKISTVALILAVALFVQVGMVVPVLAEDNITVVLNETVLEFDVAPQLISDRTMVPMRKIFESLGARVDWEEDTQTITATDGETLIVMQVDNVVMSVDGNEIILDAAPQVVQDRTLVPVRAVAEGLRAQVEWIEQTQTVVITRAERPAATATPTPVPESTPTPSPTPTPTPVPTETPSPGPVAGYKKNPAIPDFGAAMGVEYKALTEPDTMITSWCYEYEYDEKHLQSYIDLLEKNGFEQTYESDYGYGGNNLYFKKGDDGLYIVYGSSVGRICVGFWEEGSAIQVLTETSDKSYRENAKIPNYGNFASIAPLRADKLFDANGKAFAVRYTYPWEQRTAVPGSVMRFFYEKGWDLAGPIALYGSAISMMNYMKDNNLVNVIVDQTVNQISFTFTL